MPSPPPISPAARLAVLVSAGSKEVSAADLARSAIDGGAGVIQLREKILEDRELLRTATEIARLCEATGTRLVINDRPDIALLVGAWGVHVGRTDLPIPAVRRVVGPNIRIGASAHDPTEIAEAIDAGADMLGVGTVFGSPTKPSLPARGLEVVRCAAGLSSIPFHAIGGIAPSNVDAVLDAGAWGIAVSSSIFESDDPRRATEILRRAIERRWPVE